MDRWRNRSGFAMPPRALSEMRNLFSADRASEDEVAATIRPRARDGHYRSAPAVGVAVAEKENRDPALPMIVLSTAHAAKFPDAVEAASAFARFADWLSDLEARPKI